MALAGCEGLLPYTPSSTPDQRLDYAKDTGKDIAVGRKDLRARDAVPRDSPSERREAGVPQTKSFYSTKDTMIDLQGPDANYGGCPEIFIQNAWDTVRSRIEEYRVLFAFDLSSIASTCAVKTASLLLFIKEADGDTPISVNQLSEEWDEGAGLCSYGTTGDACWQDRKTSTPWKTAGGTSLPAGAATIADGSTSLTWNAHALVQAWVAKPSTNYGLMLTTPYSPPSSHYVKFFTRASAQQATWPRLTVTFTCNP